MEETFEQKLKAGQELSEKLALYGIKLSREFPEICPKGFKNLNRAAVARGYLVAGSQLCGQITKAAGAGSRALAIVGVRSLFEHGLNCAYIFDHPIHKRKMRRINRISKEIFVSTNDLSARNIEADFILWYQRKQMFGTDYPTEIVFGEAKSFGKDVFKDEDVNKMKTLGEAFPGAVLVFATMKEAGELSKEEIGRIRKLAEWGREYDKGKEQMRAPVIMLTGTELFGDPPLEYAWKEKGGKHAQLISPGWVRVDNLCVLADLTQQLYLGMQPYSAWLEAKWKRRRETKKKRN